jgi:hypothetical protein
MRSSAIFVISPPRTETIFWALDRESRDPRPDRLVHGRRLASAHFDVDKWSPWFDGAPRKSVRCTMAERARTHRSFPPLQSSAIVRCTAS